jgi:hypothetical protein
MADKVEPKRLAKPVDWDELYPGRFLKAADLKGRQVTVTISAVDLEELEGDGGKTTKGIISFQGKEKMIALNRTNGVCLKAMFGKKVQEWIGKRITLFPTEVQFGREMEDAIRIFGSPDIAKEMDIEIKLPKRRPIKMTMHKTGGARPAATGSTSTPAAASSAEPTQSTAKDPQTWITTLKGATSLQQLEEIWQACLQAFNDRPPAAVDDAYMNTREALGEAAGRQLDLGG